MTRTLVAVFATLLFAAPALAAPAAVPELQTPEDAVDMSGTSCARYLQYRQTSSDADKIAYSFSAGLMSGLNMSRLLSGLDSRNVNNTSDALTFEALTATMVTYCKLHPQDG
jgi:hypothetical protein